MNTNTLAEELKKHDQNEKLIRYILEKTSIQELSDMFSQVDGQIELFICLEQNNDLSDRFLEAYKLKSFPAGSAFFIRDWSLLVSRIFFTGRNSIYGFTNKMKQKTQKATEETTKLLLEVDLVGSFNYAYEVFDASKGRLIVGDSICDVVHATWKCELPYTESYIKLIENVFQIPEAIDSIGSFGYLPGAIISEEYVEKALFLTMSFEFSSDDQDEREALVCEIIKRHSSYASQNFHKLTANLDRRGLAEAIVRFPVDPNNPKVSYLIGSPDNSFGLMRIKELIGIRAPHPDNNWFARALQNAFASL